MALRFEAQSNAGVNGATLLVYNDALYQAFKAALLGEGKSLISDGQQDAAFTRKQKQNLDRKSDKIGNWYPAGHNGRPVDFARVQKGDRADLEVNTGYETTIKFVPPIDQQALAQLIETFRQEFGIEHHSRETETDIFSRVGIQYMPAAAGNEPDLQTVKIQIAEDEFDKVRSYINISPHRSTA